MRELKIAYGSSCFAKVWSNKTITFDALCERLKNTIRTPETVEEYPKLSKVERDRAKDKGGMVGGWLKQGRRKAANVECRSMLTHDIDSADPDFLERYRMLNQYASCLYSTHSHTPKAPRYRIITPLTRDVSPEEYLALTRLLAKEWGIDCVDSCSYRAHQLMYWPTTPSNGEYVFERFDGAWLNPDAFLSAHPGWRDVSLLPTSSRESTLIDRQRKQQRHGGQPHHAQIHRQREQQQRADRAHDEISVSCPLRLPAKRNGCPVGQPNRVAFHKRASVMLQGWRESACCQTAAQGATHSKCP